MMHRLKLKIAYMIALKIYVGNLTQVFKNIKIAVTDWRDFYSKNYFRKSKRT